MCQQTFTLYHPDNSGCCVGCWNAPCVVLHRGLGTPKGTSRPTTTWSKRNLTQFGFEVPSLGCIPASSLCINCTHMISLANGDGLILPPGRSGRTHHSRPFWDTDFSTYNPQQGWWRRRYCVRCISGVRFRHNLGPYSVGVFGRVVSASSAAQVDCSGQRNKYECWLFTRNSLLILIQDWFWNFMLSFFSPKIVAQLSLANVNVTCT